MAGKQKVAILKSRIYRGGVAQVLGYMILSLNNKGIVPDLLTLRCDLSEKDFEKLYSLKIAFRIKLIGPDLKMPYEWHFLYFNLITRGYWRKYDLFINSNNSSFLLTNKIKTISYIHFPRKYRVISDSHSIHFPEKKNKYFLDFKHDLFLASRLFYKLNNRFHYNEILLANSEFTRKAIQEVYPKDEHEIKVMYPPVEAVNKQITEKKMQVVSLGRISDEKRQLEQIEIALQLPDVNFYIMGFTNFDQYYKKCERKIKESGASNIFLLANCNKNEINQILSESKIFLHNVRNEPFGIGIVQAAEQGCMPVIHGSGGAIEIIPESHLHFTNINEAIEIIQKIKKGEFSFAFNSKFSPEMFMNSFENILQTIE